MTLNSKPLLPTAAISLYALVYPAVKTLASPILSSKSDSNSPVVVSEAEHPIFSEAWWFQLGMVLCLVVTGGCIAGLTLGLMSLDETNLQILKSSGTPQQKCHAERITPIRKNGHLLLVTLLLANTVINESLPVMLDPVVGTGFTAVFASTALVVVFGEIIPQAACSRYGLQIGAFFAWPVRVLILLLLPVSWPISKLLDYILGESHGVIYKRRELRELVSLHAADKSGGGILTRDEISIIHGALSLPGKTCEDVMTPIDKVFMLSSQNKLDMTTLKLILDRGHSRVPIYHNDDKHVILGVLMVKQLILVDPDDEIPITKAKIWPVPHVHKNTELVEILNQFQMGASHMALVYDSDNKPTANNGQEIKCKMENLIGIITLEDVIEEILQEEIIDETDEYISNALSQRVVRDYSTFPSYKVASSSRSSPKARIANIIAPGNKIDVSPLARPTLSCATPKMQPDGSLLVVRRSSYDSLKPPPSGNFSIGTAGTSSKLTTAGVRKKAVFKHQPVHFTLSNEALNVNANDYPTAATPATIFAQQVPTGVPQLPIILAADDDVTTPLLSKSPSRSIDKRTERSVTPKEDRNRNTPKSDPSS